MFIYFITSQKRDHNEINANNSPIAACEQSPQPKAQDTTVKCATVSRQIDLALDIRILAHSD